MNLGEKIRQLRVERRLTQEQLAEKLYVSFQTVSKWETGTTSPDLSQIVPLARLFGSRRMSCLTLMSRAKS